MTWTNLIHTADNSIKWNAKEEILYEKDVLWAIDISNHKECHIIIMHWFVDDRMLNLKWHIKY